MVVHRTSFQKELFVVNEEKGPAVVLLSGGLDSATALAEARSAGFALYALTVAYGQRHAIELEAARRVARSMGVVRHVEQFIDLRAFGGLRRRRIWKFRRIVRPRR